MSNDSAFMGNPEYGDSLFVGLTKCAESGIMLAEVINMDLNRIGKFIAALRKQKGLTQEQLGEQIGVTNKTVSRWETGAYLPPADALLAMSRLFDVTINEILSGERLSAEAYQKAAEENLIQTVKQSSFTAKEQLEFYQKKWLRDHIAALVLGGLCIAGVGAAGLLLHRAWLVYTAFLLLIAAHCLRNNAMMAYAESKVYSVSD